METILKQFKQILLTALCMLFIAPVIAQVKPPHGSHAKYLTLSRQLKEFYHLVAQANVTFVYPNGFLEIKAPDNEDLSFDYALELPGKNFEIWFQVKSEKENWASYVRTQNGQTPQLDNPDSVYMAIGKANAREFTGDDKYLMRNIPPDVLARYHADAGKSYLLTLPDLPETKHYKYALLITLQKNHTGTILAVCFTNEKGPEFFKNINKASNCIKFKS
jgi:hypothetical protein